MNTWFLCLSLCLSHLWFCVIHVMLSQCHIGNMQIHCWSINCRPCISSESDQQYNIETVGAFPASGSLFADTVVIIMSVARNPLSCSCTCTLVLNVAPWEFLQPVPDLLRTGILNCKSPVVSPCMLSNWKFIRCDDKVRFKTDAW